MTKGTAFAMAVLMACGLSATEWRTRSIELRLDRLYFPAGEEVLIFENSPFAIVKNADTVFAGWIEHSWEGVSVSAPTRGFFDTLSLSGLEAVVTQAEIDTTLPINVGNEFPRLLIRAGTIDASRVEWSEYNPIDPLREDFQAGTLDAIIALTDLDPRPADVTTITAPLPYIVVLVPNIRREFNYHGELTTSLYYRFDNSRLALCFKGDQPVVVNRLTSVPPGAGPMPRWYDFDPARGKKLFDRLSHRPSRLRLHSDHPILDGVARYFADILSRERCVVELTPDRTLADVSIELVPCHDASPRTVMDSLYGRLVQDTAAGSAPAEYLRQINLELRGLASSLTLDDSSRYLQTVSRIMAEDLGVFPLFRPRLFVHTHQRLRNVALSPDGLVDFSRAVRIRLPESRTGATQ